MEDFVVEVAVEVAKEDSEKEELDSKAEEEAVEVVEDPVDLKEGKMHRLDLIQDSKDALYCKVRTQLFAHLT